MNRFNLLRISALYVLSANLAVGQILDRTYLQEGPISIGRTISFQSELLSEERQILISLPSHYAASSKLYPVVYILDPLLVHQFGYAAGVIRSLSSIEQIPEVILVGVHSEDREKDMVTPSSDRGGNADTFIEFFRNELQGFIAQEYRTEPYSILIGHSAGGYFALHTLLHAPDTFNAYIALDPSVWWGDGRLLDDMKGALDTGRSFNNALFTANTQATPGGDDHYQELIALLSEANPVGLDFSHMSFPDESHASVVIPGIYRGIRAVYRDWAPHDSVFSLDSLLAHYERLSERFGYVVEVPFTHASDVGFRLLAEGNGEAALAIFEYCLEHIAQNEIAHYQLGFALRSLGRLREAKSAFERAIETGPDSHMFDVFVRFRDEVEQEMSERQEVLE